MSGAVDLCWLIAGHKKAGTLSLESPGFPHTNTCTDAWRLNLGATVLPNGRVEFRLWAPHAESVAVKLLDNSALISMRSQEHGYYTAVADETSPEALYYYVIDGKKERPDPASRAQPQGVHGPSMVVDPSAFAWTDGAWAGRALDDYIIYELHVGTFTKTGTFDAVIPYLRYLKDEVGVTAIEIMPVGEFPGRRNWGYDGTYLFAPQSSYGGPAGLKRLINACHEVGLAVVLDVVYNHLGPEGNYLSDFGPYFTDRYKTPWGAALNYDGPHSDAVRDYIVGNAVYWVTEYHIDGLRLDAIHGIYDFSATHLVQEIATAVHRQGLRLGRQAVVIAESDLNDARVIGSPTEGGYGVDAQWNDDFHHSLRVALTQERMGYYQDFHGLPDLEKALQSGFVYSGQYSAYRQRRHGNVSEQCPATRFIVFAENHDQIGNRAIGDRLTVQVSDEALKGALALVLLSPNIPLLFMGQEYGETNPFQYFTNHSDPELVKAVKVGRRREFVLFGWKEEDIPDPDDPATFERSQLSHGPRTPQQTAMLQWVNSLIQLRKTVSSLAVEQTRLKPAVWTYQTEQVLVMHRSVAAGPAIVVVLSFNEQPVTVRLQGPVGKWQLALDSGHVASRLNGGETDSEARVEQRLKEDILIEPPGFDLSLRPHAALVFTSSL